MPYLYLLLRSAVNKINKTRYWSEINYMMFCIVVMLENMSTESNGSFFKLRSSLFPALLPFRDF